MKEERGPGPLRSFYAFCLSFVKIDKQMSLVNRDAIKVLNKVHFLRPVSFSFRRLYATLAYAECHYGIMFFMQIALRKFRPSSLFISPSNFGFAADVIDWYVACICSFAKPLTLSVRGPQNTEPIYEVA